MRRLSIIIFAAIAATTAAPAAAQPTLLELRFASEDVPPGGVLQAKLEVTEPKPISTGDGAFAFGPLQEFLGLAVNSPNGDAAAAAVIGGSSVRVSMISPTAELGMEPDYPILTVTMRAPAAAQLGSRVPLTLMTAAEFLDPTGLPYPYSFTPGIATIANGVSVANVTPGSALVPAGGIVTVDGSGFAPDTELRINEVSVAETRFVSSTRLMAVLGQAATMHGRRVEVRNPGTNQRTTYFAFQRTTPLGASADPLFRVVEPAFAQRFFTDAFVDFGPTTTSVPGIALQSIGVAPVLVTLDLLSRGIRLARVSGALPADTRLVRSVAEIFGVNCAAACAVRLHAAAPVQVMGLSGDIARGLAVPILPIVEAQPQLRTTVNAPSVAAGDTLVVAGAFTPGSTPVIADAYVVLRTPSGLMLSLTPSGLVPSLVPFVRGAAWSGTLTHELLRTVVPGGTPAGTYEWLSALAEPGTLNLLSGIATTAFSVVP